MTLAVAARFPWPKLLQRLPTQVAELAQRQGLIAPAIIFAADSRWTYKAQPHEDGGLKLFPLPFSGLAVYAGNVAAGERSIVALWNQLENEPQPDMARLRLTIQSTLCSVWRQHARDGGGLSVLAGLSQPSGACELIRVSHDTDFHPVPVGGVNAIGATAAVQFFENRLQDMVGRFATGQNFDFDPAGWAGRFASLVHQAASDAVDETVGGQVVCGHVAGGRAEYGQVLRIDTSGPTPRDPERITLSVSEAQSFYARWHEQLPPFPGPLSFKELGL